MKKTFCLAILLAAVTSATADTVKIKGGGVLNGVIVRESETEVVIATNYATVILNKQYVSSIERSPNPDNTPEKTPRLASWKSCIERVSARPWAGGLRQVPATVVDKGILKYVPYISHKSGDYEFNIYGDPDRPSCIEVGMYKDLLKDPDAKHECRMLMATLLCDAKDVALLKSLNLQKDKRDRDGLTFEITPETDEDAYGGWWISIYSEKALDSQRASAQELGAITVRCSELGEKKPLAQPKASSGAPSEQDLYGWESSDLNNARYKKDQPPTSGLVYVRGYYRKDGTYVHPYTRHAPHR